MPFDARLRGDAGREIDLEGARCDAPLVLASRQPPGEHIVTVLLTDAAVHPVSDAQDMRSGRGRRKSPPDPIAAFAFHTRFVTGGLAAVDRQLQHFDAVNPPPRQLAYQFAGRPSLEPEHHRFADIDRAARVDADDGVETFGDGIFREDGNGKQDHEPCACGVLHVLIICVAAGQR
jgi:hypothetical protein